MRQSRCGAVCPWIPPSAPPIKPPPVTLSNARRDRCLANSSQGSRLLRFVVERTLEGRADEIKESVLGVEVFGRPSFDPRTDPIARVEASRLRQRLTSYYEGEGRQDTVRIILPKGSYVPIFE